MSTVVDNRPLPDISVVSPVYGCKGCLEELVDAIERAIGPMQLDFEVVLVDDASPDGAWSRIEELACTRPWLRGLRLSRNFGQHSAISAGIEHARGDWVVVMDCDLQDPPAAIPALYREAISNRLEVVFAQRLNRKDSSAKRLSSWGFFKLLGWLTGFPHDAREANFGVFRRNVIDAVIAMPERDRSFPLMVKWAGFRRGSLPIEHSARNEGKSGYTLRKLLRLATGIAIGYSEKPLQLVALSGMCCSLLAFAMVGVTLLRWLEGDVQVAGYASIIASIWLLGGLLLFSLGVVGLYVGQVFRNAQARPYYIVAQDTKS